MLDPMIRAFALTVLVLCAATARAEGSYSVVAGDSYSLDGRARTLDARPDDARRDHDCDGWNAPAPPVTASPLTLPAGDLIEGDSGLRVSGVRGTSQLLRAPRDPGGARCQWAPQPPQLQRRIHHQLRSALPSPLLLAGLQTWATATPPPFRHC